MPRGQKADLLGSLRTQASKLLKQLEDQIDKLEREIADLRTQGASWRAALGGKVGAALGLSKVPGRRGRPPGVRRAGVKGDRVKWEEVLASVPKRFGVQDVMKHPGAAAKGRAQVYPALNRWEATKRIKRVEQGVYEKVGGGSEATPAATVKRGPAKKRAAAKTPTRWKKRGRPSKAKSAEAKAS